MEDIVIFLVLKVFVSKNRYFFQRNNNAQITFLRKPKKEKKIYFKLVKTKLSRVLVLIGTAIFGQKIRKSEGCGSFENKSPLSCATCKSNRTPCLVVQSFPIISIAGGQH